MSDPLDPLAHAKDTFIDLCIRFGPKLLVAILILSAGFLVAGWAGRGIAKGLHRFELEPPVRQLLTRVARILVVLLFAIMALQNLGVELLPLLAGLGVAGAGIALATQGVLSNMVAGLTIIFTKPYRVGQYIAIVGVEGQVDTITLFSTTLTHADQSRIIVPNRKVVGEILHNYGRIRQPEVRGGRGVRVGPQARAQNHTGLGAGQSARAGRTLTRHSSGVAGRFGGANCHQALGRGARLWGGRGRTPHVGAGAAAATGNCHSVSATRSSSPRRRRLIPAEHCEGMAIQAKPIRDFALEVFFSKWEFAAKFNLAGSDCENMSLAELLALAGTEDRAAYDTLSLGYTQTFGAPALRAEIARTYDSVQPEDLLCFAGAEEAIYVAMRVLLDRGDHAVVITPNYQAAETLPLSICEVTGVPLDIERNWELDIERLRAAIKPNTKLISINFPNNPTGKIIPHATFDAIVELCRSRGLWLFSDEVYRLIERDAAMRLPQAVDAYERGISLNVMSKAYGLAGLRIGWLACKERATLVRFERYKHFLSICNSATSEVLAQIALKARDRILARNRQVIDGNLAVLNRFFFRLPVSVRMARARRRLYRLHPLQGCGRRRRIHAASGRGIRMPVSPVERLPLGFGARAPGLPAGGLRPLARVSGIHAIA